MGGGGCRVSHQGSDGVRSVAIPQFGEAFENKSGTATFGAVEVGRPGRSERTRDDGPAALGVGRVSLALLGSKRSAEAVRK